MNFEKHVFISYAHIDNQPLTSEQQGWITRFNASLEAMLSMRMGGQAKIWRDSKLRGNDIFADEIVEQFPTTALLVSVLTPRYLNSEWCTREVREFCECAQQSGGLIVDNKARVFKVIKAPVDTEETLPPVIQDALGYEFFAFEDGTPLELDPAYGEKFAQDYNRKVGVLAWDIVQVLKKLEPDTSDRKNGNGEQSTNKPMVYLAECSYDRRGDREKIDAELKTYGYTVMPDQQLPRQEEEEYVAAVKRVLACCTFSIHLVGESYGAVPDGPSEKSVVMLQNEIALQQSKSGALRRVIWLPRGASSTQTRQQAFIDALHSDSEAQFGAELITGDLEELKASIRGALKKLEEPEEHVAHVEPNHNELIYLICDEKDRKATVPVRKFFRSHGVEVSIPVFEGDATTVRKANQELLATCDAVILFYGAGDEAWRRATNNELIKMKAYREGKPLLANYIYLADPNTSDKEDLIDMGEPNLISGFGGFSEAEMTGCIQTINASRTVTR